MQTQSLKDLKEENAEAEGVEATEPQEVEEAEEVEVVETEEEELEGGAEAPEGEAKEVEIEAWQVEEEGHKTVPLSALQKVRGSLKEKLRAEKSESEELRKKIEALEAQGVPQAAPNPATDVPTLEQFAFDEGKYQQAMANYQSKMIASQISQERQQQEAQAQQAKKQQEIERKTNAHYERAQELVSKHGINPEVYGQADRNVREAIDRIMPSQGDSVADLIISTLGEGSEKVMYAIGRNESELSKLQSELLNDPSGLSLATYLGQKKAEFTMPARKKSQAPKPSRNIQGETAKGSPNFERRYKDAQKKGDASAAFKARIEARRQGIDTRDW